MDCRKIFLWFRNGNQKDVCWLFMHDLACEPVLLCAWWTKNEDFFDFLNDKHAFHTWREFLTWKCCQIKTEDTSKMTYPPSRCSQTVARRTTLSAFSQTKASAHLTARLELLAMAGILTDPLRKSKIIFNLVF